MTSSTMLLLWYAISLLIAPTASLRVSTYREKVEGRILGKRQTAILPATLGQSLYWFGHWTVGDTPDLKLLIDTGSTDLLVNPGLYKPSANVEHFVGHQNFTISYEGVNRAGFGFETLNGTLQRDIATAGGLTVNTQAIGSIDTYSYADTKPLPYAIQGQGIIGFGGRHSSSFDPPARSWYHHLCYDGSITECRFALAFGTTGVGSVVVGEVASDLIDGPLTAVRSLGGYTVKGDVTLNGKVLFSNQTIIMDVGTDNIQGPIAQTKQIFSILGYPSNTTTGPNTFDPKVPVQVLQGTFPCDSPPALGFAFPAAADLHEGQTQRVFEVSQSTGIWDVFPKGNGTCTSILGGTNALTNPKNGDTAWLLGQPFFAGHYVDFHSIAGLLNFGNLANPETGS